MNRHERLTRIESLVNAIPKLTNYRLNIIDKIVSVFDQPIICNSPTNSSLISVQALNDFGDILRIHHCFSREPFSKDKFEYAIEAVLKSDGLNAVLADRGKRGFDLLLNGEKFSLKTEASKNIKISTIHISKFMELGGGEWSNNPDDLKGLRSQFLKNLKNIDRVLILRALKKDAPNYVYELVEIPKSMLLKSSKGKLEMKTKSKQNPKPGYCYVVEKNKTLFDLYFDGGGERKLQIKKINKELCIVHAIWKFTLPTT